MDVGHGGSVASGTRSIVVSARLTAIAIVILLGLSAVPNLPGGFSVSDTVSAAGSNYVKVGVTQDVAAWNPLKSTMEMDYVFSYLMYSCLYTYDQDWNGPINDLAIGVPTWHANGNGTWTIVLNVSQHAYFRSAANPLDTSHPLTADDAVFTINLILDNPGGSFDSNLKGVLRAFVRTTYTLAIDMSYPKATIIDDLAGIPILPRYIWENIPDPLATMSPQQQVGSGPMFYNSSLSGLWYRFTKAPNYHGAADYPVGDPRGDRVVGVDGVLYTVYADPAALTIAMNSGLEDCIDLSVSPLLFLNSIAGPFEKYITNEPGIIDVAINAIPPEFRRTTSGGFGKGNMILLDPIVRKALGMTMDRSAIQQLMYGLPTQAWSVLSPSYWQADIAGKLPFDQLAAKTLLQANGYIDTDADGCLEATASSYPVVMGYVPSGTKLAFRLQVPNSDEAYVIVGMSWAEWARTAGIQLNLEVLSDAQMINYAWYKADYDIWVWAWTWGPEPLSNLKTWLTSSIKPGGDNVQMPMGPWWKMVDVPNKIGTSAFDENFTLAQRTFDNTQRKVIVDKLQQWIYGSYTELPPVYSMGLYVCSDARFVGWGNWTQHVGRTIMSDLPWLWFDLAPASSGNQKPEFVQGLEPYYNATAGVAVSFTVSVHDEDGDPMMVNWSFGDGVWAFDELPGSPSPQVLTRTHTYPASNLTEFAVTVTVTDYQQGHQVDTSSTVFVTTFHQRTVDYRWYDMFNVPFESYWNRRWTTTGVEQPITSSYPYIYIWHGAPLGNIKYYSDARLNVTGRTMGEINMNERPEFLPYLGAERGGNALIDWHFDYMTHEEVLARLPAMATWDDGWFLRLTGTITLDQQAAKSVLGLTDAGFADFATWWGANGATTSQGFLNWLKSEGNVRLDIYPMYEYSLTFLAWNFSASRVGDNIVITQDHVSWGMEALMARWTHESFLPSEQFMYAGTFHMRITPTYADLDLDSAVMYSMRMAETTLVPAGATHGDPCWVWEPMLGDYVSSSVAHPHSDFDPYQPFNYSNTAPGSAWYGKMMPYDYTPGAWNLTVGETLRFEWPAGEQLFIAQAFDESGYPLIGETVNATANMAATYSEPDANDFPSKIAVDSAARTLTFVGPIDMWSWSKDQQTHPWLDSEWERIGLLPYGIPSIEFGMVEPEPTVPKIDYRLYDMFEPKYGDWFAARQPWYYQDYMLLDEPNKRAHLYLPDPYVDAERALIYAPYRWSMNASSIDWVTVDHPYIMPTTTERVPGARASIDLTFDYITSQAWNDYWIPTWGWMRPDKPYNETVLMENWFEYQSDGYQVGALYNITMNREAAYQWLGIPLGADIATWYNAPSPGAGIYPYQDAWITWIENEGNNRLDIYSGYDDLFYYAWNWMKVQEVAGTGDVLLTIATVHWGYEVLMTRWLAEADLCPVEPYWADFKLKAACTENGSDIWLDGVGMYNLHAVKSNTSATNEGAWAWEPTHIDYVSSWSGARWHPSEYDSYANLTYTSWDAGNTETYWGQPVSYTATPTRLNLTNYMTLTVELPQGQDVPFFLGQSVPVGSVDRARAGDISDYQALEYAGPATLGYTIPSLSSLYNASAQTLTMRGPMTFDNPRGSGSLLYHGAPWIEIVSGTWEEPEQPRASSLAVDVFPGTVQPLAGTNVTVTVLDQFGDVFENFTGTIWTSSTDPFAILPGPYTFILADHGVHVFHNVRLATIGSQVIYVQVEGTTPPVYGAAVVNVTASTPPTALFSVSPDHGDRQTVYSVDASLSHDAESSLTYRWDWDGDGYWDTGWSAIPTATHIYTRVGVYDIKLQVMDAQGLTDEATAQVSVGITLVVSGNQKSSVTMWTYIPRASCMFSLVVENNGLRWMTLDIFDITTGSVVRVFHDRMRLSTADGTFETEQITILAGHEYVFSATPIGHKGATALVYGSQSGVSPPPLFVSFVTSAAYFTVWVDASACGPDELIASYEWDWGDGYYGSGVTANHTYAPTGPWGGSWTITLTITDIFGRTASRTTMITIVPI